MIERAVAVLVLVAALVGAGLWIGKHRASTALPPMVAHCASGLGGTAICTEWSSELGPEKQLCQKREGTWRDGACPTDVSNAAGVCVVTAPTDTSVTHYASAWKGRAQPQCDKHGGRWYPR